MALQLCGTSYRKKGSNQSHNLRDALISPTIDPTFRERVYRIIEFAAVPINVSPPTLYTLDVALLARCPFHSVGSRLWRALYHSIRDNVPI
jgi:hypothetical protein